MPSDQLKAEITIVYKRQLPENLNTPIADFFVGQSASVAQCAAHTSMAGANSLALAVFSRHRQDLVFLYFKDDVHTLKVHLESLHATALDTLNHDLEQFQKQVVVEIGKMERFSKFINRAIDNVNVVVSLNDSEISTAQQKRFSRRLAEGIKSSSLVSKASGVIATGIAGYLLQMDPASAAKGLLAGLVAIVGATIAEAALGDAFKFHRS